MSKEIFTYFDSSPRLPYQGKIIHFWYYSWKRAGWTPRILTPRTWRKHPERYRFRKVIEGLFPDDRNAQCRGMALLALAEHGKSVFFSDYDTVNYGLTYPMAIKCLGRPTRQGCIYACEGFGRYCLTGVLRTVDALLEGHPHFSLAPRLPGICCPYGDELWQQTPLIHFSRAACRGERKYRVANNSGRSFYAA